MFRRHSQANLYVCPMNFELSFESSVIKYKICV